VQPRRTQGKSPDLGEPCILPNVLQGGLRALGLVLTVLVAVACVGQVRSYPLYPKPEVRRDPGTIARLTGPVATVDGMEVADKGMTFDLLPGCHLVTLLREIGESNGNAAWMADLPLWVFAFKMRGGFIYSIEYQLRMGSAQHGSMAMSALERSGSGDVVGSFSPISSNQDVEDCRQWEKTHAPSP